MLADFDRNNSILTVNGDRITKTVSRITRGLYFHHLHKRLPDSHAIHIESDWFDGTQAKQKDISFFEWIVDSLESAPTTMIGGQVFWYRFSVLHSFAEITAWLLSFYNHRLFLCLTRPPAL